MEEAFSLLREIAPNFMKRVDKEHSFGYYGPGESAYPDPSRYWSNPLQSPLPSASMSIHCLYGVHKSAERSYRYHEGCSISTPLVINREILDASANLHSGVKTSNGDGTVPLMSLGFMCIEGWKNVCLVPAGLSLCKHGLTAYFCRNFSIPVVCLLSHESMHIFQDRF